jgi:MFS family permease
MTLRGSLSSDVGDIGKAESQHREQGNGNTMYEMPVVDASAGFDELEEKRITKSLLWKLDTRMLPMLAILFLFSFLDRTNIGNAKVRPSIVGLMPQKSRAESSQILGLQTDLKLDGNQYANCLAIFFAFYIASEVPSNLVIKKVSPRIWLGVLTTVWGIIGMAMGFVKSYTGLMVVRAFLGATEGGLLPGIVLYLSMMYRRKEIGIRLGLIYSSASLSGA